MPHFLITYLKSGESHNVFLLFFFLQMQDGLKTILHSVEMDGGERMPVSHSASDPQKSNP